MTPLAFCAQVGSMSNQRIWNAQTETWEGSAIPRTMEGDEAHYTAFLLGTPSLQAAGCTMQRILHLTIAMGRLLGEIVDRADRPSCPRLIPPEHHLCLLLEGPPLDQPRVDDLLNHLSTRHWGWFISF